ncbi:class I SAM-dependent methyltransferase [Bacillus sp. PAMC26568]|nr:class I SAM-dependent methyltransferase [Bacillus sp. PAMC26568]
MVKDTDSVNINSNNEFKYRDWWEHNYAYGGTSGLGSYGKLAEFKAEVINSFINKNNINSVIEYGCGDGNQLSYMNYKNYIGLDIANSALQICREKFKNDATKTFELYDTKKINSIKFQAELVVCLDVLYHIIDDYDFEKTLEDIFTCASKYVVLYTRITTDEEPEIAPTIKDRDILRYLEKFNGFKISEIIKQKYPSESSADFIILERI